MGPTGARPRGPTPARRPTRLRRSDGVRGSASVEFAAVLPLALIALLLVVQVALVVAQQLVVQHAAREGAREAAVWNDDARAREAALRAGNLDPDRADIEVTPSDRSVGTPVRVTVHYRVPLIVPYVSRFLPSETSLSATAEYRVEREPG
ncbi:MAG: TadE/TadG family type IV pilus assembly protein [Actinomycetota bacterium]